MDGWTVIHYGQMEMEAVWKTEFLFNCDTLGFVSIQNVKKKSLCWQFLTKWRLGLPPQWIMPSPLHPTQLSQKEGHKSILLKLFSAI